MTDQTFATNQNVPILGSDLYRFSSGHGTVYCSACQGQSWVDAHNDYAQGNLQACAYCHGVDFRGTPLSVSKIPHTFPTKDGPNKTFPAGHQFNCYDCHNGPNPG